MKPFHTFYLHVLFVTTVFIPCIAAAAEVDSFVVFGKESVTIGQDAIVDSGHLGSNGVITVNPNAVVSGHVFANNVILNRNVSVGGDVNYNELTKKTSATVNGSEIFPIDLPIVTLPTIAEFTPGLVDLTVPTLRALTIRPSAYNVLRISRESQVVFSGGVYSFNTLLVENDAVVSFSAPTTLNVAHHLEVGSGSFVTGPTIRASEASINYPGDMTVSIGPNVVMHARVFAPNAHLSLGNAGRFRGLWVAKSVRVGKNARVSRESYFALPTDPDVLVMDDYG